MRVFAGVLCRGLVGQLGISAIHAPRAYSRRVRGATKICR
jgi:hypothetical protein